LERARRQARKHRGKPLWYEDESEIHLLPVLGAGYGTRGEPLVVWTPGQAVKEHLFLAANWWTGRVHYRFYPQRRSEQYADFERKLAQQEGQVRVGLDNCNIHYQKAAQEPVPGVERLFLPSYAWWLQPLEKLFDWLKGQLTNVEAKDIKERKEQVRALLKQLQSHPRKVLKLLGNQDALEDRSLALSRRSLR